MLNRDGHKLLISDRLHNKLGPRPDLFSYRTPEHLRGIIGRMRVSKQEAELTPQPEKELAAEARAWFSAKTELKQFSRR